MAGIALVVKTGREPGRRHGQAGFKSDQVVGQLDRVMLGGRSQA